MGQTECKATFVSLRDDNALATLDTVTWLTCAREFTVIQRERDVNNSTTAAVQHHADGCQ